MISDSSLGLDISDKSSAVRAFSKQQLLFRALLTLVILIIFFLPILRTGYIHDDGYVSSYDAILKFHNISGFQALMLISERWAKTLGRLSFLALADSMWPFVIFNNLLSFKVFVVASVLASFAAFALMLKQLGADYRFVILSCLFATSLIQFRYAGDPFLAFSGLMPILSILIFGCIGLLASYLSNQQIAFYIGSVSLFFVSLLTYEIAYPFALPICWIILGTKESVKRKILLIVPFIILLVLVVGLNIVAKSMAPSQIYSVGHDPRRFLKAFLIQAVGVVPFMSLVNERDLAVWSNFPHLFSQTWPLCLVLLLVTLYLIARITAENPVSRPGNFKTFAVLGASLLFLPPAMLALSNRYQGELQLGLAHIPIYFQYFGAGLLLGNLISIAIKSTDRFWSGFISGAFAFAVGSLLAFSYLFNSVTILRYQPWLLSFRNMQQALEKGLLDDVPEYATIKFANTSDLTTSELWQNPYFFYKFANKKFDVVSANPVISSVWTAEFLHVYGQGNFHFPPSPETVVIRYFNLSRSNGVITLERDHNSSAKLPKICIVFVRTDQFARNSRLRNSLPEFLRLATGADAEINVLKSGSEFETIEIKSNHKIDLSPIQFGKII